MKRSNNGKNIFIIKRARRRRRVKPQAMAQLILIMQLSILSASLLLLSQAPVVQANPNQYYNNNNSFNSDYSVRLAPSTTSDQNENNHSPSLVTYQSAVPLPRRLVVLSNNSASSGVRALSHANSHFTSHHHIQSANVNRNETFNDRTSDNQTAKKDIFEKHCIGTNNRLSVQNNRTEHYHNLVERYRNCTHVIGNLEITWIEKGLDLSFLESIREITGYLFFAYIEVDKIRMPNLQIIRGRELFKLTTHKEEFAMFLSYNDLKAVELPNLREILAGSFGSFYNQNLCYLRTINWDELLNTPPNAVKSIFIYNGTEPQCPSCDDSCQDSCWGDGPEMCQKFSKINCSPQCHGGRCFGGLPRECCHLFCAGGCTGPKQTDCLACKAFSDDGQCIQECPSMMHYNPSKFLWETNPNGKYAWGAKCVKECPEHLLRDNGACVKQCPDNKRNEKGECITCNGPCPKNCQGVEVVNSKNIDQLINCTVIEGSITILETSFTGYMELQNGSLQGRIEPMHPDRLEVFKTVREITGFLNIQANHSQFKNLSFFRNLQQIGGRQTTDMFYTLSIIKTSLVSLNLRSLKRVRAGKITIEENKDLCFANTIDWSKVNITKREDITSRNNADGRRCKSLGMKCHEQCTADGCWGPGPDECISCKNYKFDDICVEDCESSKSLGVLSYDSGNKVCKRCHSECKSGCHNTDADSCYQCKNVKDGPYCVSECPRQKFNSAGICKECDKSCTDGCSGPSNKLGEGGCNSCGKAVIHNDSDLKVAAHCIKADEPCPQGYFQEYSASKSEGVFKSMSDKPICRKCNSRCKRCKGMGAHISVCECANYVAGEQCEDYCPRDYYANSTSRQCIKCSPECNGCRGPTDADCITCRVYRIYSDSYSPSQYDQVDDKLSNLDGKKQSMKFNCTSHCPPNKPHRISESNMLDPYCSEDPGSDSDNPHIVPSGSTSFLFILIIVAAIMFCISVYRCQIEKDKTVKLTMRLSGFDDVEPLKESNMKPNLSPLNSIKQTDLRKGNILGSGFGGTVYQGIWYPDGKKPRPVAIKFLKDNGQSNRHKEFLNEAFIMACVNHPNLVRLLGVCATPEHFMLVTPLMPLGCLLEYVRTHKNEIGAKNLLEWCKQIARGMAYLEENRMVHRDLALRNVLLQTSGKALISDFGLAKLLEVDQSEYHSGGGRLPIKWLAPECINEKKFTHKSDVWAFGVTIWELLTFGMQPFENYEAKEVPEQIIKGLRLSKPSNMSIEVYKVMYACWMCDPDSRPDFKTLVEMFVNFARDPERYMVCGTKGITYNARHEVYRNDESDENASEECGSELNSVGEVDSQPRSALPDLLLNNHNQVNDKFAYEMRHHSESETFNGQQISTPTLKKINMFQSNGQQLIEEDIFSNTDNDRCQPTKTSNSSITDTNNNSTILISDSRLSVNGDSCWSMHHTVSTNSLGQKSEIRTDEDDYLIPSPLSVATKVDKFKFATGHKGPNSKVPPTPTSRDPPHSAGLIGISNEEYFIPRINYVNSNGTHGATNASSGHIPHSLV